MIEHHLVCVNILYHTSEITNVTLKAKVAIELDQSGNISNAMLSTIDSCPVHTENKTQDEVHLQPIDRQTNNNEMHTLPPISVSNGIPIFPLVSIFLNDSDRKFHFVIDTYAQSSFVRKDVLDELQVLPTKRNLPLDIYGFGETKATTITHVARIRFENGVTICFNVKNDVISSALPPVGNEIFHTWPSLHKWKHLLACDLPRSAVKVDFLIGISDLPTFITLNNINQVLHKKVIYHHNLKLEESYFGYILSGSLHNKEAQHCHSTMIASTNVAIETLPEDAHCSPPEETNGSMAIDISSEQCNITIETPLDLLLTKYFSCEDELLNEQSNALSDFDKLAIDNFHKTTTSVTLPNGNLCYQVNLNRLPEEYTNVIDGKSVTTQALMRFYALERR